MVTAGSDLAVNLAGAVQAKTGDVFIGATAPVTLANVSAGGAVSIESKNGLLTLNGDVTGQTRVTLSSRGLEQNAGLISSGADLSVTSSGGITLQGRGIHSGTDAYAAVRTKAHLNIRASGAFSMSSGTLESPKDINIYATNINTAKGTDINSA